MLRVGTQRVLGGATVSVGGVDAEGGTLRAHLGVARPGAGRPSWVPLGGELRVPGWGVLTVVDVRLALPGRVGVEFVAEGGAA